MLDYVRNFVRRRKTTVALRKITLGICAMVPFYNLNSLLLSSFRQDKKARSKPMKEIIARFPEDIFQIVTFGDDCILNQPIENWPVVECLIAFYSNGYPLAKAIQYVDLVHPFLINDLKTQYILQNRRSVYEVCDQLFASLKFLTIISRSCSPAIFLSHPTSMSRELLRRMTMSSKNLMNML
jgi:hypothetical protein